MIKINFPDANVSKKLTIHDIIDGRAYIVTNAAYGVEPTTVFICNKYQQVALFSLDGRLILTKDDEGYEFEEVDLEVQVNRK